MVIDCAPAGARPALKAVSYTHLRLSVGYPLNEALAGGAIGRVIQSRAPELAEGDLVSNGFGFRERFVTEARRLNKVQDEPGLPLTVHMHVLGGPGFTGYGGILHIAQLKDCLLYTSRDQQAGYRWRR